MLSTEIKKTLGFFAWLGATITYGAIGSKSYIAPVLFVVAVIGLLYATILSEQD